MSLEICNIRPVKIGILLLYLFLASTISGCIFPHPVTVQELPYSENELAFIKPGYTTRLQVESEIGKPDLIRDDNLLSLYGDARRVAGAMAVFPALGSNGASFPVETEHLLLIRYDSDDIVRSVEVLRLPFLDREICTTDEICIKSRFVPSGWHWWFDYYESVLQRAIVFARPDEDADVKTFKRHDQKCTLFIYHNERLLGNRDVEVHRVSPYANTVSIDEDGYIYWTTQPGLIALSAGILFGYNQTSIPVDGNLDDFIFDCRAGKQYFINIELSEGWFKLILKLTLDDPETGKISVLKRRLMID